MTTRAEVVAEARAWIGTRFHHQASLKGVGCDCIGLVRGVGTELGIYTSSDLALPEVQQFKGYARTPTNGMLKRGFDLFAVRIPRAEIRPGDIILMRFESEPQHVAIVSELNGVLSMIHSYALPRKVVEHSIDTTWRSRIVAAYSFPGVE